MCLLFILNRPIGTACGDVRLGLEEEMAGDGLGIHVKLK